jgi:hypothetical protein
MAAVPLQMLGQGIPGNLFTPLKCILCGNSCGIKLREVSSGWKDLGRADDVSTIALLYELTPKAANEVVDLSLVI